MEAKPAKKLRRTDTSKSSRWRKKINPKLLHGTCNSAAFGGHVEVLEWAIVNGYELDTGTCANAAWGGHLEVLIWLRERVCVGLRDLFASCGRRTLQCFEVGETTGLLLGCDTNLCASCVCG